MVFFFICHHNCVHVIIDRAQWVLYIGQEIVFEIALEGVKFLLLFCLIWFNDGMTNLNSSLLYLSSGKVGVG